MDRRTPRVSTGVAGIDEILDGGLIPERSYLVSGGPGAGKTVLGLHFLTAGDGNALFVNFEETAAAIEQNAAAVGIDTADVTFLELSPGAEAFTGDQYDVFDPDEVEGQSVVGAIREAVEDGGYDRVFIDPLTHLNYLTPDAYRFRKEVGGLFRFLTESGATVLFSVPAGAPGVTDLEFLADGGIAITTGTHGRRVEVVKFRGSDSRSGRHTARIDDSGMTVYPELDPGAHQRSFEPTQHSTGVPELDDLLHGGIERGTVTVISGPTGVGKTTTGTAFLRQAALEGERSVVYTFEEAPGTLRSRSAAIGIPVEEMEADGLLAIEEVDPLAISPDEFAARVRTEVEERDAAVVMIDSVAGYRLSLRGDEETVERELHRLCRYLRNMGVTTILPVEVSIITGDFRVSTRNISHIADNILFMRYIEVEGRVKRAIGVLKKRTGTFESTLRELEITGEGVVVGDPLEGMRDILTGTPALRDDP